MIKTFAWLLFILATIVSALSITQPGLIARFVPNVSLIAKRDHVYTGTWVGGFWSNDYKELDVQKLKIFENLIGHKVAIANLFSEWEYLSNQELIEKLVHISEHNWTPMISTNPYFFAGCKDSGLSLYATIAKGNCDEFLRVAALNIKSYNKPVFIRFAWEMNLPDMYWSIERTDSTPEEFINAWRHIHTLFMSEGATNIVWVLSFNTSSPKTVPYALLYPGDKYVDWVAIDGYNWGNTKEWSRWTDFSGVFRNSYQELTAITEKPVMLSEVNSTPTGTGGNRAEWLADMLNNQIPKNYSQVEAVVFFSEEKVSGEGVDWRLEVSPEDINVIQDSLRNPLYKNVYP